MSTHGPVPPLRAAATLVVLLLAVPSAGRAQPTATPTPDVLQSIALAPDTTTRSVGQFANYTATGTYRNGTTRNLTQRLEYSSSDPAVAVATNSTQAGQSKSRVEAVAIGTATISARDPVTGITTTVSGGDATLTVVGRVESITLEPATATRQVGGSQTYTATGNLEGGGTRNLTQRVVYSSSDPSIAAAPNQEGNRSLVQAVGVGTATISATDPETSIGSDASGGSAVLTVVAAGPTATPGGPTPSPTPVASCGDADGSGSVTVSDGVEVLGFAAALASDCSLAVCDVDGSGAVTVTDGVNVLRAAAELPATLRCAP